MQSWHLQKVKIIACITLLAIGVSGISSPAFGVEFKLRELFQNKVKASDKFINSFTEKADTLVDVSAGLVTLITRKGFFTLERRTGLNEQNLLYRESKKNSLETIGFGLGVLEGTKDFATGTVSLLAYLESSPARAINLAYNIKERPLEYKKKVIDGGKTAAGILANPLPLLGGMYQWGKNTYLEAQRDPLKMGKLQGEVTIFGGTLLLGGGQFKAAGKAGKAFSAAKVSFVAKANTGVNWDALISDLSKIKGFVTAPVLAASFGDSLGVTARFKGIVGNLSGYLKTKKYPIEVERLNNILNNPEYSLIKEIDKSVSLKNDLRMWGKQNFRKWQTGLLPIEKKAIKSYTEDNEMLNLILRKEIKSVYAQPLYYQIDLITSALKRSEVPESFLAFRGTSKSALGKYAHLKPEELIGKTFEEKGFMSTSLFPREEFIDLESGLHMTIKVPQGTKGAYLGSLSEFPLEGEILFPPGQKMIIREAKYIENQIIWPDGIQIVTEIIP